MQDITVSAKTWIKGFTRVSTLSLSGHCSNNDSNPPNAESNPTSSEADKEELEVFGWFHDKIISPDIFPVAVNIWSPQGSLRGRDYLSPDIYVLPFIHLSTGYERRKTWSWWRHLLKTRVRDPRGTCPDILGFVSSGILMERDWCYDWK